jgi:uncharacterized protein YjaZ
MPRFLLGSIVLPMLWMWQLLRQPRQLRQLLGHQLHHKHRLQYLPKELQLLEQPLKEYLA